MSEKPSLTQAPANASLPSQEFGPKPTYGSATAKLAVKHPHFAVTPGKLWTAFLYRWKTALVVALVFAAIARYCMVYLQTEVHRGHLDAGESEHSAHSSECRGRSPYPVVRWTFKGTVSTGKRPPSHR